MLRWNCTRTSNVKRKKRDQFYAPCPFFFEIGNSKLLLMALHSAYLLKKMTKCNIDCGLSNMYCQSNDNSCVSFFSLSLFLALLSLQFNKFQLLCSHAARSPINRPTKCIGSESCLVYYFLFSIFE